MTKSKSSLSEISYSFEIEVKVSGFSSQKFWFLCEILDWSLSFQSARSHSTSIIDQNVEFSKFFNSFVDNFMQFFFQVIWKPNEVFENLRFSRVSIPVCDKSKAKDRVFPPSSSHFLATSANFASSRPWKTCYCSEPTSIINPWATGKTFFRFFSYSESYMRKIFIWPESPFKTLYVILKGSVAYQHVTIIFR